MTESEFVSEFFPEVDPQYRPYGPRVLVQFKLVRKKSSGGIILAEDTRDIQRENTVLAKVVGLGPIAYCNRESGQPWPEGHWAKVGDIVTVPKWGGFRFQRKFGDEAITFSAFQDHEISGCPTGGFEELDKVL